MASSVFLLRARSDEPNRGWLDYCLGRSLSHICLERGSAPHACSNTECVIAIAVLRVRLRMRWRVFRSAHVPKQIPRASQKLRAGINAEHGTRDHPFRVRTCVRHTSPLKAMWDSDRAITGHLRISRNHSPRLDRGADSIFSSNVGPPPHSPPVGRGEKNARTLRRMLS